jgi:hypothetical protein
MEAPRVYDWEPREPVPCDRCGFDVQSIKCKMTCTNCGAMRDCSDP